MPFGDLGSAVLGALGKQAAITVTRYGAGDYSESGEWVEGLSSVIPMTAHVQPATPKEIHQLPENERTKESIAVYTKTALKTSDVSLAGQADKVVWAGRTYKVMAVEDWVAQAQYAKALCVREGE